MLPQISPPLEPGSTGTSQTRRQGDPQSIGPKGFAEMGKKGGKGRLRTMTPEERTAIATKAGKARAAAARKRKKAKKSQ
jgi:hypothetical protein